MDRILLSHEFLYRVRNPRTAIIALRPILLSSSHLRRGPGSVVGIATGYGLDGPGIESRWRRDFPHLSRSAPGPTQPAVQWVPGLLPGVKSGRGVTLTPHPLLVPWSRKSRAIPLLPLRTERPVQSFSACTRVNFTFFPFTSVRGLVPLGFSTTTLHTIPYYTLRATILLI